MRRASIAAVLALLMSMQAFAAIATCVLLPCCAPVATQCPAHDQAPITMHHPGHHHAGMHHAQMNPAAPRLSSASTCAESHAGLVANIPKARANASRLVSPKAAAMTTPAPITRPARARNDANFSPPIHPSGIPLRI